MNPPNEQTPLDYLNQIAPEKPKRSGFGLNLKTVLIGAGGILVLTIVVAIIASSIGSGAKENWERLSLRLDATEAIAEASDARIKNSQLRSINSEIKLYLTDTKRDLTERLDARAIETDAISDSLVLEESNTEMTERLESGRLNAKYDSTYAREMTYLLGTILVLYQTLYTSANSAADTAFLENAYDNLEPIEQRLAKFSASSE